MSLEMFYIHLVPKIFESKNLLRHFFHQRSEFSLTVEILDFGDFRKIPLFLREAQIIDRRCITM